MGPPPDGLGDQARRSRGPRPAQPPRRLARDAWPTGRTVGPSTLGSTGDGSSPVKVTFLGGLGEIGRNCAAIEVDGRLMLLDCGLMFPDVDMLGIDLVLPDFTWLRENADRIEGCIVTHGHEDHVGGLSFLLRELSFPIYRLGAHARAGPQPHRGGGAARPHRADRGARRRAAAHRPVRRASSSPSPTRCPTASPPRSTRRRARSSTPATSSSTSRRSTVGSPTSARMGAIAQNEGIRLLLSRLDQRRRARPLALASARSARCCTTCSTRTRAGASSPPASPATSTASSRSPTRRSPSTASSPRSACRCSKNVRLAREMGLLRHPRFARCVDIEDVDDLAARQGVRDLDRLAGRADVGAGADGGQREPLAQARRRTTR